MRPRSNSACLAPPRYAGPLEKKVNKLVETLGNAPSSEDDLIIWKAADLAPAKLDAAREISAISHRDAVPPHIAYQGYAKLSSATGFISRSGAESGLFDDEALASLNSLLLGGELHHVWNRHAGQAPLPMPTLYYGPIEGRVVACHEPEDPSTHRGTRQISTSPKAVIDGGGMAMLHEVIHAAQGNLALPANYSYWNCEPKVPAASTKGHPREGTLETARDLPPLVSSSRNDNDRLFAAPRELQAGLEQAAARRVKVDYEAGLSDAILQGQDIEPLIGMLVSAARELHDKEDGGLFYDMEPDRDAMRHVEKIMGTVAALREASCCQGWSNVSTQRLRQVFASLSSAQHEGVPPAQRLEAIAAALSRFLDDHHDEQGWDARMPRPGPPSADQFEKDKHGPVHVFQRLVTDAAQHFDAQALPIALTTARSESRFEEGIQALQDKLARGQEVTEKDLQEPVAQLAAALVGVKKLPEGLLPAINLTAASAQLPSSPELDLDGGQQRKPVFQPLTWQLHISSEQLKDPQKIAERLAGAAADMAYAMAALMEHDTPAGKEAAAGMEGARHMKMLDHRDRLVSEIKAASDRRVQEDPNGVAAALRLLVRQTPLMQSDMMWHDGWRTDTKAQGFHDPDALAVYRAKAYLRWQHAFVAFHRAVRMPTPLEAQRTPDKPV